MITETIKMFVNIKKKREKINSMVLLNSFTTSMYKKATNKKHFIVGMMMEKIYNSINKKKIWPAG